MNIKLLCIVLAILMLATASVIPVSAEGKTGKNAVLIYLGDVDKNGSVTAADALLALQNAVGKIELDRDKSVLANADSKDGVTAADALLILQSAVGKISDLGVSGNTALASSEYTPDTLTYAVSEDEKTIEGPVTTFQEAAGCTNPINIPTDSVMAYIQTISTANARILSWERSKDKKSVNVMMAINRDCMNEYYTMYPERKRMDSQMRKDGSYITHPVDGDYMVPTTQFIDYKWQVVQECLKHDVDFICFEEPEMWNSSGYSEGFKAEWKDYYGTDWVDQSSSAEALYMTSKLKVYLFKRAVETLSARIKEAKPNVKVYIAAHSSINYTAWGITSSTQTLMNLDCIDGIIAQAWSDTAREKMPYNGESIEDGFTESYFEYGTFVYNMGDKCVYTLADPKADGEGFTWDEHKELYKKSITAQLLHTEIDRYEVVVWASRSFVSAPAEYKTMQLNVIAAQQQCSGKAAVSYAGTPGIYLAQSDNESWQYGTAYMAAKRSSASLYAIAVPLIKKGIPIKSLSFETVTSAKDLAGVRVLILGYDYQKPMTAEANQAVADWVKAGGVLLYLGGHDEFEKMGSEWWGKDTTPLCDLLKRMGLDKVSVGTGVTPSDTPLSFTGSGNYISAAAKSACNNEKLASFAATFSGSGFSEFLKAGADTVGIEAGVSKGHAYFVGLPSAYYGTDSNGAELMRGIMEYALLKSDVQYVESDIMISKQGSIVSAESFDNEKTMTGNFIDLFDPDLNVLNEKKLAANDSALLFDYSDTLSAKTPVLAFSGGKISELIQDTDTTSYTVVSPANALVAARLMGNGKYPESISVTRDEATTSINGHVKWDASTGSLLIKVKGYPTGTKITVKWGSDPKVKNPEYDF